MVAVVAACAPQPCHPASHVTVLMPTALDSRFCDSCYVPVTTLSNRYNWRSQGGPGEVVIRSRCDPRAPVGMRHRYVFSLAIADSTRDVDPTYQSSAGKSFPLEGPVFGGAMLGGPAWFYLLAIPLVIHKSWLAVAFFAGTIAGLKFTLAYTCGRGLVDRRFGLIWALVLALPGWSTIEQVAFTNVNVAETCVLAAPYLQDPGVWRPRARESVAHGDDSLPRRRAAAVARRHR
jgi:hypothetical protein